MSEFIYQLKCLLAFLLGHAAPPERTDVEGLHD